MGFHAPQEMARILGESIDLSRQAQIKAGEILRGQDPSPPPWRRRNSPKRMMREEGRPIGPSPPSRT